MAEALVEIFVILVFATVVVAIAASFYEAFRK
jgi:hypothetical protein